MTDENDRKTDGNGNGEDDDTYVLEDTGSSVDEIEHEMEMAAQQAADAVGGGDAAGGGDEALRQENRDLRDRVLRTMADYENFRKRAEREKQDFFRYALAGTMKELLPVLDNFERALEHSEEDDDFHKGVSLIYKQLNEALQKAGLRAIVEANVKFDPNIHEAVVREEDASVPSHTVVAVLQKGYFLNDRLLRPALVKVAVGGPEGDVAS
ncbi:MAG TPA: nucleotide exchange factor GrpE [Thermoanaerobaculia bacterium]|nr:nucleotide exchange factor GrpE [Thermoanaerobaculia bacterium]